METMNLSPMMAYLVMATQGVVAATIKLAPTSYSAPDFDRREVMSCAIYGAACGVIEASIAMAIAEAETEDDAVTAQKAIADNFLANFKAAVAALEEDFVRARFKDAAISVGANVAQSGQA